MEKKTFLLISISLAFSLLVVFLLLLNYFQNKRDAGGFTRLMKDEPVTLLDSLRIGHSFYLAGLTSNHIYLSRSQRVPYLLKCSYNFEDTAFIQIQVPLGWEKLELRVDSPYVYIMDGTVPGLLYSKLPSLEGMEEIQLGNTYFSTSILTSPQSLILKAYNGRQEVLTKKIPGTSYTHGSGILKMQNNDGLFSLSGQLEFDPRSRYLLYLYYFRNQFIYLDTGLNILYKGNTIDTISTAEIDLIKIKSNNNSNTYAPAKPPLRVNRMAALTAELIFVNSALKADNEDLDSFENSAVIDVYAVNNGKYHFSFYLPDFKGQKLSDFMVYKDILIAVFGDSVCIYELNIFDP